MAHHPLLSFAFAFALLLVACSAPAQAVSASGLFTSSFSLTELISPSLYESPGTTFTGSGAEPYHYLTTEQFFTPQQGMTTQDRFTPSVLSDDTDDREDTPDHELYWVIMASSVFGAVLLTFVLVIGVYGCIKFRNSRRQYEMYKTSEEEMDDIDALGGDRMYDDDDPNKSA